jgi:predicted nucleic acid-binding protein
METRSNDDRLIIADASGLVSVAIDTDANHQRAIATATQLAKNASMIIIPSEIFAETINILGKKFGHASALHTAQTLLKSPDFLVIDTEELTRLSALELFQTTPAGVSFTDCLVMATADEYETREIFGFDEIFSKKGYQVPAPLEQAA